MDVISKDQCLVSNNDNHYIISTNGEIVVYLSEENSCVIVLSSQSVKSFKLKDVEQVRDIKPNTEISLSYDSKFLLVQFNAGDSEHVIKVISLDGFKILNEESATFALWMKESNRLIIVPSYGVEDLQQTKGLVVYSPETNKRQIIAKDYFFIGTLKTGGEKIVGDIVEYKNGHPIFSTITYDLK